MSNAIASLGKFAALLGFLIAIGAQIFAFVRIVKYDKEHDSAKAMMALLVPGYILYYVWRSENRMPRVLNIWIAGFVLFIAGLITISIAVEM